MVVRAERVKRERAVGVGTTVAEKVAVAEVTLVSKKRVPPVVRMLAVPQLS